MSVWIRFEDGRRSREDLSHASITKDGRLIIPNVLAIASGVTPGKFVEIFYQPNSKIIGLKRVAGRTPFAVKVTATGSPNHPFDQPIVVNGKNRGRLNAVVSLRSFLHSRHIGLASKVKGEIYFDVTSDMLCFEFPSDFVTMSPSSHAARQLEKGTFDERVAGDVG